MQKLKHFLSSTRLALVVIPLATLMAIPAAMYFLNHFTSNTVGINAINDTYYSAQVNRAVESIERGPQYWYDYYNVKDLQELKKKAASASIDAQKAGEQLKAYNQDSIVRFGIAAIIALMFSNLAFHLFVQLYKKAKKADQPQDALA